MPPHLHPRSTATSTLFAGTLLASFVVIGIPHLFPCPRPHRGYADSERQLDAEGRPIARRRKLAPPPGPADEAGLVGHANQSRSMTQTKSVQEEAELFRQLAAEAEALEAQSRECPVPKPRGLIGRWLGFEQGNQNGNVVLDGKS